MSLAVLIFELGLLLCLRALGMTNVPGVLAAALIIVYSVAYIIGLERKPACRKYAAALIAGYAFRMVLLLFDLYGSDIYILPNSGADTEMFYQNALIVAQGGTTIRGAFCEYMGYFFRYFGTSRLFAQFLLTLCSVVSMECAAKIFNLLDLDDGRTNTALWMICLLPNFAILSVIFLRESLVTMFISLSLLYFIKWFKHGQDRYFILAIILTFCGARFHSGSIAVPVGYVMARMLYDRRENKLRLRFKNIFAASVLLLIGVFFLNRYGDSFLGKFSRLEDLSDVANVNTMGGSNYSQYVGNSSNPLNMIIFTIPRMVFFMFSPMPWMIRGLSDIIAFCFSSCFYIYTTYRVIIYLRSKRTENRKLVIVIFIVALCAAFVFGWGVSNSGTACRHRDKVTIVWGVLLGLTMMPKERRISTW